MDLVGKRIDITIHCGCVRVVAIRPEWLLAKCGDE